MKTPKMCGRKKCKSRQGTRMIRRGIMQCIVKTQVSCKKGKASQKVWRWLDRQWTRVLPRIAHLKSSNVWNTLQDNWKLYQKNYYGRDDIQVEEFREPKEEDEAGDKNDWQIEMPDRD
jgi:hypothetical protein